jgi:hypothetical protein
MLRVRIELTRDCSHWVLSPARIPAPPPELKNGARGRDRTGMGLLPWDFKSHASTCFTTRAYIKMGEVRVELTRPFRVLVLQTSAALRLRRSPFYPNFLDLKFFIKETLDFITFAQNLSITGIAFRGILFLN